jgi:DNA polymerase III alpha subunit
MRSRACPGEVWRRRERGRTSGAERARRCDETLDGGARTSEANAAASRTVRVGLARFGLAVATGNRIVTARGERPFASLADFADRARPTLPELESLILAGALDWTGQSRPSLLLEARVGAVPLRHSVSAAHRAPVLVGGDGRGVMPDAVAPVAVPAITEFSAADRVRGEVSATGLWFSGHPLDVLVDRAALRGTVPAAEIERHAGRRVAVAGLPCASRRVETRTAA